MALPGLTEGDGVLKLRRLVPAMVGLGVASSADGGEVASNAPGVSVGPGVTTSVTGAGEMASGAAVGFSVPASETGANVAAVREGAGVTATNGETSNSTFSAGEEGRGYGVYAETSQSVVRSPRYSGSQRHQDTVSTMGNHDFAFLLRERPE